MTDEITLLPCPFCGGEARIFELRFGTGWRVLCSKSFCAQGPDGATEAEAIASWNQRHVETCEPPYDELLRCLENDWHIRASWDGLRKFWCIELTEEGVKLRDATHGTLTAEQVREAIEKRFDFDVWVPPARWQAIADELNAKRHVETCEMEYVSDFMSWHCKACDMMDMAPRDPKPRFCKWCGRRVE